MINKKLQVWLPLIFSGVMIIGMFMGYKMRDGLPGKSFFYKEKATSLQEITDLLNNRYVDPVDGRSLADTAIEAMLSKLDPHSLYIPAAELQQINEEIQGSFYGIGIEFTLLDDSLNVVNVFQDGPSDKAGIRTGDILLKAGDSSLYGKNISQERIRTILRGPEASTIKLTLLRNGKKQQTEVARGEIPITSVDASYMLSAGTGYIRLNKFSTKTYKEFMISLMALKKEGIKDLVLDLRGNGGGVLEEAIEIADEFLEGDKLITYTEGLHSPKKEYRCRRNGQFEEGKLIVLADEGTASASEVLMGALQDWDRAVILGRRSFGKGLVQDQFILSNGAALRLTVARYYTPMGRSIQRTYKNGNKSYFTEISNRYAHGEMSTADSVKNDTAKIFLSKGGKKLYAGGGISPDHFIPADTSGLSLTTAKIYSRGTLADFGYKYFRLHRQELEKYKKPIDFIRSFNISEADWKYFESLAAQDSVVTKNITPKEKIFIVSVLKSAVAQQLFRTAGYFEAVNEKDEFILKALEIIAGRTKPIR
ncbi:MAG: S41 family peptidase [Ferruginibacter sp.]